MKEGLHMAKKARFYKVIFKTAYQDNQVFYKPVPAQSKIAAKSMIADDNRNVTNVIFLGWKEIWIARGDIADSNDLAIIGITINNNNYMYPSGDIGWEYLKYQFIHQMNNFIDENYDDDY